MNSRFNFVGEVSIPQDMDKFFREKEGEKPNTGSASVRFSIKESQQNRGFVELFGFKNPTVKTIGLNKEKMDIAWRDRLNPDVIKEVADFKKITIDLGEEFGGETAFITEYDAVLYLAENLPKVTGKLCVTGDWTKNAYNGNFSDRFTIKRIYPVANDAKSKLEVNMELFYNTESIDMSDLKDDGKVYANCYVEQYVSKDLGKQLFPQQVVMSNKLLDMSNPKHEGMWKANMKHLYDELPKKNKMVHMPWKGKVVNGAEEVPFDESMLTAAQKEQIEFGLAELKDFKPRQVFGPKISEIRLVRPILTGDFADGVVICEESQEELEERMFTFAVTEKMDDLLKKAEVVADTADDDDEDDLF
jgi:hypothetical protein